MSGESHIPVDAPGDHEDVSDLLSIARVTWNRGDHDAAVSFVQRAAQTAMELEQELRGLELAKMAAELRNSSAPRPASVPRQATPAGAPPPLNPSQSVPSGGPPRHNTPLMVLAQTPPGHSPLAATTNASSNTQHNDASSMPPLLLNVPKPPDTQPGLAGIVGGGRGRLETPTREVELEHLEPDVTRSRQQSATALMELTASEIEETRPGVYVPPNGPPPVPSVKAASPKPGPVGPTSAGPTSAGPPRASFQPRVPRGATPPPIARAPTPAPPRTGANAPSVAPRAIPPASAKVPSVRPPGPTNSRAPAPLRVPPTPKSDLQHTPAPAPVGAVPTPPPTPVYGTPQIPDEARDEWPSATEVGEVPVPAAMVPASIEPKQVRRSSPWVEEITGPIQAGGGAPVLIGLRAKVHFRTDGKLELGPDGELGGVPVVILPQKGEDMATLLKRLTGKK